MINMGGVRIGLALGSGGSRGLAHIGIIKVLEENKIPVSFIAGSSAGALIGGLYAASRDIKLVEEIALKNNLPQLAKLFLEPAIGGGLLKGDKLKKFIENYIGRTSFDQLKIPFAAIATDLHNAQPVVIDKGEVSLAIRASVSIPLLFKPVELNNRLYIDGGVSLSVPVEVVKNMGADIVIAVNLYGDYEGLHSGEKISLKKITERSADILRYAVAKDNSRNADLVISPKVGDAGVFNKFMTQKGTEEVILSGENAMRGSLPKLQGLINHKSGVIGTIRKFIDSALPKIGQTEHAQTQKEY